MESLLLILFNKSGI